MNTFQPTQNLILAGRSVEQPNKYDNQAKLSARGLHHRNRQHFEDHFRLTSNVIYQARRQGAYDQKALKSSPALLNTYFRRAVAQERLGDLNKAISDYSLVLSVEPEHHQSLYNRGGLYLAKGKLELALADMNEACKLDPSNGTYLRNRSLINRKLGNYMAAIPDTTLARALELQPNLSKDIKAGKVPRINHHLVSKFEKMEDPLLTVLQKPKHKRTVKDGDIIVDFLKTLKFFENMQDPEVLRSISSKIELQSFEKDAVIFNEGDPGEHFFMIVDGEVSIVKLSKAPQTGEYAEITLVKLFRGHAFGDTALETKGGLRSAGAKATNKAHLLVLHADDYQLIMKSYRAHLQKEVVDVLSSNQLFSNFDKARISLIAHTAAVKHFNAGMEILRAGETVKNLYIIKRGLLRILKRIERPSMDASKCPKFARPDGSLGSEAPGTWVLEKNWRDSIENDVEGENLRALGLDDERVDFTVGILGSGQVFGELAILHPELNSPVSVVTTTQVEVYCFDGELLINEGARFDSKLMNTLNESLNVHNPTQEKIAYYFRSKVNWEHNKLKLLKNIEQERDRSQGK